MPTVIDVDGERFPTPHYGSDVDGLPDDVARLYEEARASFSVSAYTASVLCSRKILMSIAVSKGAPEGQKFVEYVIYLRDNSYVPRDAYDWVDHIRDVGNQATHEIPPPDRDTARELLDFVEMLLKVFYEFPARHKNRRNTE